MPTVVVNGVAMEAKLGERLLDVARRNSAHIGFVCDGNGICQTCQCRVVAGADQLNPPNSVEKTWMPEPRLREGYRLACQAGLRGKGEVEIITTVEELRSRLAAVVSPPAGSSSADNLAALVAMLSWMNIDQLAHFPFNILDTVQRLGLGRFLWPFKDLNRFLSDGARVAGATLRSAPAPLPPPAPLARGRYEARLNQAAAALEAARKQVPPAP